MSCRENERSVKSKMNIVLNNDKGKGVIRDLPVIRL
jgi:hypothetical protein